MKNFMKYFPPMNVNEWSKSFKWTKNYIATIQGLAHKFWVRACNVTQQHLTDLYGTYLCRVVQNESKERKTSSVHWIVYEIRLILLDYSGWPQSANCMYLRIEVRRYFEKDKAKMKILVVIANKIFITFSLWKLWQGSTI